jgi:integral membrane protein (TIGR01906 family)
MSKHKKLHDKGIIIVFSIALFIIIIFGSLNFMIFNKNFYYKEYSKNHVYDNLPSEVDAKNVTDNVIRYFRNIEDLKYFTADEKSHMQDVKHLIRLMQFIYYGAAAVSIILFFYCYKKFKNDRFEFIKILAKSLLYSSIAACILLVLIFLMSVFAFNSLFTTFHLIFFPQGNWMFSPDSLLITLFPESFFFDISIRIFIYAIFQALIFLSIGYWMNKQLKIVEKHNPFR